MYEIESIQIKEKQLTYACTILLVTFIFKKNKHISDINQEFHPL